LSYANYTARNLPPPVRYVADLARYRHLALNLVGSDLRSRFRRSHLGILWAVLQPLGFSLIVASVWSGVFKSQGFTTFVIYVFSGMLVWEYFSQSVLSSLDTLTNSRGYLKQARIPFLIFQLRVPLSGQVILLFGIVGLLCLMAALDQFPPLGVHLLLLPLLLGMLLLFVIPLSILASIIGPTFRDARHIIGLALQALFFLSPVILDRAVLHSDSLILLQFLNPMVPLLDMFRAPLLDGELWSRTDVLTWACWTGGLWVLALLLSARAGRGIVFAL
jgi:lipopolysaccharide transport system permease protein